MRKQRAETVRPHFSTGLGSVGFTSARDGRRRLALASFRDAKRVFRTYAMGPYIKAITKVGSAQHVWKE